MFLLSLLSPVLSRCPGVQAAMAQFVIENSGSLQDTHEQVRRTKNPQQAFKLWFHRFWGSTETCPNPSSTGKLGYCWEPPLEVSLVLPTWSPKRWPNNPQKVDMKPKARVPRCQESFWLGQPCLKHFPRRSWRWRPKIFQQFCGGSQPWWPFIS